MATSANGVGALATHLIAHEREIRAAIRIHRRWRSTLSPEDILQDTYLLWLEHRQRLNHPVELLAWAKRHARRRLAIATEKLANDPASSRASRLRSTKSCAPTPLQQIERAQRDRALARAVAELPDDYWTVLRLSAIQSMSNRQIAVHLGRNPSWVADLLQRARHTARRACGSRR